MTGLLYLLNIACSSGQSALCKQYAKNGGNSTVFNINKALAGIVIFVIWACIQGFSFHLPTALMGVGYGVSLCVSMHTGFKALKTGPMALTSIIASFSLLVPFVFGICFWNESLTACGIGGIILLSFAMLLINWQKGGGVSFRWLAYAVITLLTNGICSVIQKFHQIRFPSLYRTEFMIFALLSVLLILAAALRIKRPKKQKFTFTASGLISGVLNGAANYIVLLLSATENASVLFPIMSIGTISAVWIIGIVFFKEKLTRLQTIGLIFGGISVILLKI